MNQMLADTVGITSGHYAGADWAFLIALIVAGIAAIAYATPARTTTTSDPPRSYSYARWAPVAVAAAIALIALGLLLL
jgi:hypothetical protein